ncbi:MAG: hypothetical protein D6806_17340, partial [Deltaproteobacteria bacterium]
MKRTAMLLSVGFALTFWQGCMMKSTHEQILRDEREAAKKQLDEVTEKLTQQSKAREECEKNLAAVTSARNKLQADLAAKQMQIKKLLDEKGALT